MRIANENEAMYGKEPSVKGLMSPDTYSASLSEVLNWYNFSPTKEEKKEWFIQYLTDIGGDVAVANLVPDSSFLTAGTLARLWLRGVRNDSLQEKLDEFTEKIVKEGQSLVSTVGEKAAKKQKIKEAQFKAEVSQAIAEFETVIDGFMETGKSSFDAATWFRSSKISKDVQEILRSRYQKLHDEVVESDSDPQLKEGYSNYTKKQKTVLLGILTDLLNTKVEKVPGVRKARKKKNVSPEKMVKKLQYQESFKDLNLKSIDPSIIVGATSLWVYNTKRRILTNYVSDSGIAVKRSTLLNINEQESKSKKVRKPEVTIPEVMTAGKVPLRRVFENLTTGFLEVNGRINKDTILLRVVK